MDSIKIKVQISRELLDFLIDEILKADQDPLVLHTRIAEVYSLSSIEVDRVMVYLEKEGVLETDIYGVKATESPRYYSEYSSNKVYQGNRQTAIDRLMAADKVLECERDEKILEAILKILEDKNYSFKEIKDELQQIAGEHIDWIKVMVHLLELQKEKKIGKGFVEREGHSAEYYAILRKIKHFH